MPPFSFVSPVVYVGAFDITADLNKIDGNYEPNFLDTTTFGSGGWRARISGLTDVSFNAEGFNDFSATGVDANMDPLRGAINVVTVSPNSSLLAGDPAYLFQALMVGDHASVTLGEISGFALPFKGKSQMVKGIIGAPRVSRTATGTSSAVQLGTSSNGQLFSTRHIFTSSGNSPTLATFISSATNSAMLGAVTRASFTTASASASEWLTSNALAVTSASWWNVSWVIGGTGTPTFDFAVGLSIR